MVMKAHKDKKNPFFKSDYADLASCWDACRDALTENFICVIQSPTIHEGQFVLETVLAHASGESLRGFYPLDPVKKDPQGFGSAVTYARRYALQAMVGITPSEDDGNAASGGSSEAERQRARDDADKMKQRIADDKKKTAGEEERKKKRRGMYAGIKKFTEAHGAEPMDTTEASLFAKWIAWKKAGFEANEVPFKQVTSTTWNMEVFTIIGNVVKEKQNYETARELFVEHMKAHPEDAEAK